MIFISLLILIVVIAIKSIYNQLSPTIILRITSLIFIYSGALSLNTLYFQYLGKGVGIYTGYFEITSLSQFIDLILFSIAAIILISWPNFNLNCIPVNAKFISPNVYQINKEGIEYSLITLFSTLGSSLLISSNDLISMYLSIELQSFGLYILPTLFKHSKEATNSGLKYFLLGCLASCLILLGSSILYSLIGLTQFESIRCFVNSLNNCLIFNGCSLALIIIFIGFLFKIAAASLHQWSPSVYDESPTIVTIWLTIMPKISIIIFLLTLFTMFTGNLDSLTINFDYFNLNNINVDSYILPISESNFFLRDLVLISSLLSLLIGTIVGLAQIKIKRLLAYSTISHIGFLLLALAINSEQSIDSLIFYLIQYTLTNLNTFLILLAFGYLAKANMFKLINNKGDLTDIKWINEFNAKFFNFPILSLALTFSLFSMAGIPPFIGFFAKQFVLASALANDYYFMAIIGIFVSIISASYYLKIIKILFVAKRKNNHLIKPNYSNTNNFILVNNVHSFIIAILTLIIIAFTFYPNFILNSTQLLALDLFYF